MPRLYLIVLSLFICVYSFSQSELTKILSFADEKYQKGDYVYAVDYYRKALDIDSTTVDINWKYAEALRQYKDYERARYYYQKVYEKEDAKIYKESLLYWALMEKQCGNYKKAIDLFKLAKKKYSKYRNEYVYLKSKRELESCLWAQAAIKDTSKVEKVVLPENLNTENSEFAHLVFNKEIIFSSLKSESEVIPDEKIYRNKLYRIPFDSTLSKEKELDPLNFSDKNTGNGTFSHDGLRYYYSICEGDAFQSTCKIAVSRYLNGKWQNPEILSDVINESGKTSTTPCIAWIDNEEWLIFSSNREAENGMDLYFSIIKNGNQYGKVKPLKPFNSIDNEICPWFDEKTQTLYFSSSWWDGFGGYDIHQSTYTNDQWGEKKNSGIPFNSSANDVYFFKEKDSSFLSSNRLGVKYSKNPTCCSDVFAYTIPDPEVIPIVTKKETLDELNKRLPVTLYFHNDCPDPKTTATSTNLTYDQTYQDYTKLQANYQKEYAAGLTKEKAEEAVEDIESFFLEYVDQGFKDLSYFEELVFAELEKGLRLRLNVRGFASPLAKTDYNVALTKRRIASLKNHLMTIDNGKFAPYLDGTAVNGGKLEIEGLPFGEYTADQVTSDNPNDQKNSIYSRAAAKERKIEIQSISYLDTDSLFFLVDVNPNTVILGKIATKSATEFKVILHSNHSMNLTCDSLASNDYFTCETSQFILAENGTLTLNFKQNRPFPTGFFSLPIELYFKDFEKPIRILVLGETE